jgi:hypothetical protein
MIGLWARRIRALRCPERRIPEELCRLGAIDLRAGLENGNLDAGLCQPCGQQGASNARSNDDDFGFDLGHRRCVQG